MTRHRLTGQVARALRSVCLPILCFLCLPIGLSAQSADTQSKSLAATKAASSENGKTTSATADTAAKDKDAGSQAANPAPEPDTLLLLGTGAVVLLLLYTRRRVRVLAPQSQA